MSFKLVLKLFQSIYFKIHNEVTVEKVTPLESAEEEQDFEMTADKIMLPNLKSATYSSLWGFLLIFGNNLNINWNLYPHVHS